MLTPQTETLIRNVREGRLDPAQTAALERMPAAELLSELASVYRISFQERQLGNKWERGIARSFTLEPRSLMGRNALFPILVLTPVLRNCLLLSGEGDAITGIAVVNRLSVRPTRKPSNGLALTTGKGFQLDKTVDGWIIKPMAKRTTRLSAEFLKKRGWRLEPFPLLLSAEQKAD